MAWTLVRRYWGCQSRQSLVSWVSWDVRIPLDDLNLVGALEPWNFMTSPRVPIFVGMIFSNLTNSLHDFSEG